MEIGNKITVLLLFIAFSLIGCKNNQDTLMAPELEESAIHRYWFENKGLYQFGKIRVEKKEVLEGKVRITDSIYFDKIKFLEILENTDFQNDTLTSEVQEGVEFEVKEKVNFGYKCPIYNVFFPNGGGSGIIYSENDGIIMRYNSHSYEYLLMESWISDGTLEENYFDEYYLGLNLLNYIPKY